MKGLYIFLKTYSSLPFINKCPYKYYKLFSKEYQKRHLETADKISQYCNRKCFIPKIYGGGNREFQVMIRIEKQTLSKIYIMVKNEASLSVLFLF